MSALRRRLAIYGAIAATAIKGNLAYSLWVWADLIATITSLFIFVYFWRAVYAGASVLGGLTEQQTIAYILLARLFAPLVETRLIFFFGWMLRNGQVAVELTRPLDMQARMLAEVMGELAAVALRRVPLFVIAWAVFGLRLPTSPAVWGAFIVSLLLGSLVMFLFDWMFASLAFYVTETWGLSVVRIGVASFFSGALVPLAMLPGWLQSVAAALPFAQALAVPVSILSGIAPLSAAPRLFLVQLAWLAALLVLSRAVFGVALRKVTVQGG